MGERREEGGARGGEVVQLNRLLIIWIIFAGLMGFAAGGSFVSAYLAPPPQHETSSAAEHGRGDENSKEKNDEALARYTLWLVVFTGILALATVGLGIATVGLYATGEKQIGVALKAANAAELNAEALISAERAQLFVIVKRTNLFDALMGTRFYRETESMRGSRIPRPELEFTIKNTGRTAAIMQDVSYQIIQADPDTTMWQYAYQDTIVNSVIEGGDETAPPTPCMMDVNWTLGDGIAATDGDRPVYFYGFIVFRDAFKRRHQYFWRHEYRDNRFVLVHEEEQPAQI